MPPLTMMLISIKFTLLAHGFCIPSTNSEYILFLLTQIQPLLGKGLLSCVLVSISKLLDCWKLNVHGVNCVLLLCKSYIHRKHLRSCISVPQLLFLVQFIAVLHFLCEHKQDSVRKTKQPERKEGGGGEKVSTTVLPS